MTKVFSIFGSGSGPQLGPFEQQVLRRLWSHGSATVRELLADGKIHQAYTTVMTTVDRLYKKGLLDRVAEGRAFRYTPPVSYTHLDVYKRQTSDRTGRNQWKRRNKYLWHWRIADGAH